MLDVASGVIDRVQQYGFALEILIASRGVIRLHGGILETFREIRIATTPLYCIHELTSPAIDILRVWNSIFAMPYPSHNECGCRARTHNQPDLLRPLTKGEKLVQYENPHHRITTPYEGLASPKETLSIRLQSSIYIKGREGLPAH